MRQFSDRINWEAVSQYQTLSEEFIRDFQDKVDWKKNSLHQNLPESFLIEFKDKIDWFTTTEEKIPQPPEE
jgi:hypothetical protein